MVASCWCVVRGAGVNTCGTSFSLPPGASGFVANVPRGTVVAPALANRFRGRSERCSLIEVASTARLDGLERPWSGRPAPIGSGPCSGYRAPRGCFSHDRRQQGPVLPQAGDRRAPGDQAATATVDGGRAGADRDRGVVVPVSRVVCPRLRTCGDLVVDGVDAVSGVPADRGWDLDGVVRSRSGQPGQSTPARVGSWTTRRSFDAGFFGISPREALAMDPQQRLLLETSWEALERAGIDPVSVRGSQTGVFAGIVAPGLRHRRRRGRGRARRLLAAPAPPAAWSSGRVAYSFGFEGPAMTVDTACSSSLVGDAPGGAVAAAGGVHAGARGRRAR